MKKTIALWCISILLICQNLTAQVDFRKETIYFLLPTRFFDGDPTNNRPNEWCSYIPGVTNPNITDPNDVTWRGDFKGLIQKLDYIKDLGFTAIWITPVVQNRGPLDYHGYHAWDFTKVDPRLESPGATFKDLVDAVHAKGMKLVLDIVTNHSGRYGIKNQSELKYNTDPTKPWGQTSTAQPLPDNPDWQYDGMTPNPLDNKIWSRSNIAKMPAPYNADLSKYNWPCTESFLNTSDINWFHHSGNGYVQGWDDTTNCYQRAIADDCPDLNTGSQTVQDYFFNAYKTFIDDGVDAFRWDTWKHMNKADIIALISRFKTYKPDLFIFGEVAQKRFDLHPVQELNPHWYTWKGNVGDYAAGGSGGSVLDFYAEATFHNTFQSGAPFSGVQDAARYDNLYFDPTQLVTWLDNHDFGPNNDWNMRYSGSDENLAACMNFMFTWRGIPVVYYGTEMRFKAGAYTDLHDAAGINKSLNETGRAYYGDAMSAAPNHIIYKHIKKINAIRKAIPALQNGTWQWAGNAPYNGVGYTRQSGASFVCVGLAKDGAASFNFTGISNGTYKDAVTGRTYTVSNGNLAFTVTSGSAGIYVLNGPGMIGESGAGFFEPCVSGCTTPVSLQISPVGDNYTNPVSVTMSAGGGTSGYTIRYTTDGSIPTISSPIYSGAINVSTTTTVKAIAWDANGNQSELQGERYTFAIPTPSVSITPGSGNYYTGFNASITASGGLAPYIIYYTTDGTTPTIASTVYTAPIAVSVASSIKAIAKDANNAISSVATTAYTFNIPAPTVAANPAGGNFNVGTVNVTLTATSPRAPVTIYYTTDGTTPTTSSLVYSTSITLTGGAPVVLNYIGVDADGRVSAVATNNFTFYPIADITVYFKKPAAWANAIKIHYWNGVPSGVYTPTTWPGLAMTPVCNDWYKFTFSGITSTNLIFNDGGGNQTANLSATQTAYYDNGWLAVAPNISGMVADFTANPGLTGTAPLNVTFNGSVSTSCSGIQSYSWDLGNGQTSTSQQPVTNYTLAGTYNVTLTITDANGQTATITKQVVVTNAANGFWVYFQKPASWGAAINVYYWSKMPGNGSNTWPGTTATQVCGNWYKYFFTNTTYTNLIFNDGGGNQTVDLSANSATTFIGNTKVLGAPNGTETLFANFTVLPVVGVAPLSTNFASDASLGCAAIASYTWAFGDGATGTGATPAHTYVADGVYTASLTTTDVNGVTATTSKKIVVGQAGGTLKVHFKRPSTWANTPNLYFWSPAPTVSTTAWPGQTMTDEGNGWYVYTVTGANCANVILNNPSPQTADLLNICGEQWYDNGWLSQLATSNILPVQLLRFAATAQKDFVAINWTTTNEINVANYVIERSADGIHFAAIGTKAALNTSGNNVYLYDDVNLPLGKNKLYYRLRVLDRDGKEKVSAIQIVAFDGKAGWSILPNPVHENIYLNYKGTTTGVYKIEIFTATGALLFSKNIAVGQSVIEIPRNVAWAAGVYYVSITSTVDKTVVKEKLFLE